MRWSGICLKVLGSMVGPTESTCHLLRESEFGRCELGPTMLSRIILRCACRFSTNQRKKCLGIWTRMCQLHPIDSLSTASDRSHHDQETLPAHAPALPHRESQERRLSVPQPATGVILFSCIARHQMRYVAGSAAGNQRVRKTASRISKETDSQFSTNGLQRLTVWLTQPSDATANCDASPAVCQKLRLP